MDKKVKILILIIIIIILSVGIYYFKVNKKIEQNPIEVGDLSNQNEEIVEEVKEDKVTNINIFKGNERPIAFMIDNNKNAQPQASINSTYMVYEIIVEGGETRLMALFKGVEADLVGPIRSSRHYFLDYAMENDAIYAHLGMSPQADADMKAFNINSINGQIYDTGKPRTDTSLYWRVKHKKAPHNAYTNTSSILKIAKDRGYKITSEKESVLNYTNQEINLQTEDSIIANTITIPYTDSHKVRYEYTAETKRYTRYSKNKKMTDEVSKEDITTKNIIITFARNYTLKDKEQKGRQDVVTVGELDGYYITNGRAIKIKCTKKDRTEQTTYVDLKGNEINVNDGNTWVNICTIDSNISISEK